MADKPVEQLQVPPYAPRDSAIRWRRFIIGAIIIWLLLLIPNGIDVYRHRNDPPDDLVPASPMESFEIGAALITVAYVLVLGVVVAAIKFFHGRYGWWKKRSLPGAPDKPGG